MRPKLPAERWKQTFRRRLLAWFSLHARDLPWRRTRSAFAIWVSEIMLQQTQVVTVIPYFERFIARFPTIEALANAAETEVLRLWEGLGYYRRARQLHRAAQAILAQHDGVFPEDLDAAQSLPGIGRYTAGAVLSIAFDARLPILEANTVRLLSRLLAFRGDPRRGRGQRLLWAFSHDLLPRTNSGVFNQALMELGSLICTPRDPDCTACPVARICPTRAKGWQHRVPQPKQKPRYESSREVALVIWRRGRVLVRQCRDGERWAGMWDFPRFEVGQRRGDALRREIVDKTAALTGCAIELGNHLQTIRYGVTRFRITLHCYQASYATGSGRRRHLRWMRALELEKLPLSVTGRKLSRLVADGH